MDRRYYKKYENFETVVPRVEDFPILNSDNQISSLDSENSIQSVPKVSLKADDLVLLGVLFLLLMEEEKDVTAIVSVAAILLAGYIF